MHCLLKFSLFSAFLSLRNLFLNLVLVMIAFESSLLMKGEFPRMNFFLHEACLSIFANL